jgi:hypothetical protein
LLAELKGRKSEVIDALRKDQGSNDAAFDSQKVGYVLVLKHGFLSCFWKGSVGPTSSVVRSMTEAWCASMPNAIGYVLEILGRGGLMMAIDLLPLVAFIRWSRTEARRIGGITEGKEQQEAWEHYEHWCSRFDSLPEMIKAKALDFADPYNPFNPANRPDARVPVVLPDVDGLGLWMAHRAGDLDVVGCGDDQYAALEDLGRLPPEGFHRSRVAGVEVVNHKGFSERVRFKYELIELKRENRIPLAVSHSCSLRFNPTSDLTKAVEGILGRTLEPDEPESVWDLERLVGLPVDIVVKHRVSSAGDPYSVVETFPAKNRSKMG